MESVGMDFNGERMRGRYQALIRQLVPLIERGDWSGVVDYIEREWRVWDILFVWNSLRQLGFIRPLMNGKPLEKEEAVLEALLRRRLMKCFLAMGWWGAVAGDERGKGDPLLATPGQLEAAIIQKGEAGNAPGKNDMEERIFKTLERLDVGMAKSLAQGDRLEAQGDETRGLVGEIRWEQMTKKKRQRLAGKEGAAKGAGATSPIILKAREEAARDLEEACAKVKKMIDEGTILDAACREVCDHFRELPGSKKGGKTWEPLLSARLKPDGSRIEMEPTSLIRRYGEWCKEKGYPPAREQVKLAKKKKSGK